VTTTTGRGEQALLFLNRRGYAPLTLCRACGHRLECPQLHRLAGRASRLAQASCECHHCGFVHAPLPDACPSAAAPRNSVRACGPGVERLAEEVAAAVPRRARRRSWRATLLARARGHAAEELVRPHVTDHEIDMLIGTQVVAKGHHFPNLTLVGVVDADLGLAGGDLRAGERTFQLLHPGCRAAPGAPSRPGRVWLADLCMPDHPVMQRPGRRRARPLPCRPKSESREARPRPAAVWAGWPP
jgi:primosomal protein N' (replication factor Y) (superfamily II helicase)